MSSKKDILFSIIVPVYNTERYIKQCVDSILKQDYEEFELILVDDGSSDNSPKICDDLAKKDKRVQVIHQPNGRQTKARKAGLSASKGEYILFVDSDDWVEPDILSTAYKSIEEYSPDIVTFDAYFNYENRKMPVRQSVPSGFFDKNSLIDNIYPKMIFSGRFFYFGIYAAMWNKVFRRSILEPNIMSVDENIVIGEDGVTTFASFLDAQKVCVLGDCRLYDYRDNNISITRSYCKEQFNNTKLLIKSLRNINKEKAVYDLSSQIDYYFMYNVYSIFLEEFYYRHPKSLARRIEYLRTIIKDKSVMRTVGRLSFDSTTLDFRCFFKLLKSEMLGLLIIFTIILAMKKRLKIYLRGLTGRN